MYSASSYAGALQCSLEIKGLNMFHHDNAFVHKSSFINTRSAVTEGDEMKWPAQSSDHNHAEHLRDELELRLCSRPLRRTSVPDLFNALVAECANG